ncbi:MAG: copper transporter [Actinomycetota bacterium]
MISFRYHVVTVVAVFLALAIGLLGGGAFVQPVLQQQLERQTQDLRRANADLREQLDDVRAELAALDGFTFSALRYLAENRLFGTTAVIVAHEDVEDAVLGQTQQALSMGGTEVVAQLSALPSLVSDDLEAQTLLAEIVGAPAAPSEELPAATAAALAERLAAPPADGALPEDDVLNRLLSAGFLDTSATEGTLEQIGQPGQIVVVLAGGQAETPALAPEAFAIPLVQALAELDVPVAAGESATTPVPFVQTVSGDGVVTVDDLDLSIGAAALVLGLDRLLETGEGGAYGLKDGTEPLPPFA